LDRRVRGAAAVLEALLARGIGAEVIELILRTVLAKAFEYVLVSGTLDGSTTPECMRAAQAANARKHAYPGSSPVHPPVPPVRGFPLRR
jgi:hypothetical protein